MGFYFIELLPTSLCQEELLSKAEPELQPSSGKDHCAETEPSSLQVRGQKLQAGILRFPQQPDPTFQLPCTRADPEHLQLKLWEGQGGGCRTCLCTQGCDSHLPSHPCLSPRLTKVTSGEAGGKYWCTDMVPQRPGSPQGVQGSQFGVQCCVDAPSRLRALE